MTHYYGMVMPDKITLYKANIERSCKSPDEVYRRIEHTIEHEIAHHFGISDRLGFCFARLRRAGKIRPKGRLIKSRRDLIILAEVIPFWDKRLKDLGTY